MVKYETLVRMLDDQVPAILSRQVLNAQRPDYGGFVTDGIAHPTSVSTLSTLGYAYVLKDSPII